MNNRAWTVNVDSEGLSSDNSDLYVVIAPSEVEAVELAEREHRINFPGWTITGSEPYELGLQRAVVLGRLVAEDER